MRVLKQCYANISNRVKIFYKVINVLWVKIVVLHMVNKNLEQHMDKILTKHKLFKIKIK